MVLSSSPVSTSVGHLIQARDGREFDPADHGGLLADKALDADILAHVVAELAQRSVLAPRRDGRSRKTAHPAPRGTRRLSCAPSCRGGGSSPPPYPASPAYSSAPVLPPAPGPAARSRRRCSRPWNGRPARSAAAPRRGCAGRSRPCCRRGCGWPPSPGRTARGWAPRAQKYRGEQTRPGTSRIGIGFSMPGGFQVWMEAKREPEIKAAFSAVKYGTKRM